MASYPTSIKSFTTKNLGDTIQASHPNDLQDEVTAIETGLLNGFVHTIKPATASAYDLGSVTLPWAHVFMTGELSIDKGTLTNPALALDITGTWNDVTDTFSVIKVSITDTNSAAASTFVDLQLGGISKLKIDKFGGIQSLGRFVSTIGTIAASQPALDVTQTWNAGGVTFVGLLLDITDTASAAASLLMDLRVGGATRFKVIKDGSIEAAFKVTGQVFEGKTVTFASDISVLSLLPTWDNGAVAFTAIKLNVTDTASLGASKVIDLQTGAVSRFYVLKDGSSYIAGGGNYIGPNGGGPNGSVALLNLDQGPITVGANILLAKSTWNNAGVIFTGIKLDVTNTASDVNSKLVDFLVGGATKFKIARDGSTLSEAGLAGRSLALNTGGYANGDDALAYLFHGTLTTQVPTLRSEATWNNAGVTFTHWLVSITDTTSAAASLLIDLKVGGSSKFKVDKAGAITASGYPVEITVKAGSGAGNYSTASTTYVDVDGTNLSFAVTVPNGQKMTIEASGATWPTATGSTDGLIAIADGTTTLIETAVTGTTKRSFHLVHVFVGDGAAHTFKLRYLMGTTQTALNISNSSSTLTPKMVFRMERAA